MANEPATTPVPASDDTAAPSRFVRTFAKDMARATGKPADVPVVPAPSSKRRDEKVPPAPEPAPAYIIPKAPSTGETREAVLARLKAKIADAVPAPQDESPAPIPLTPKAPPPAVPNVMAPTPPAPVSAAPERIHTYKSDFADHIDAKDASAFSVLAAQADAGAVQTVRFVDKPRFPTAIALGIALIALGAGAVYAAFALMPKEPVVPQERSVPSLIFADEYAELSGTGLELRAAFIESGATALRDGEILVAYLTRASTSPEGVTSFTPEQGGVLINALGLPAPEVFLRSVMPESTAGIIRRAGELSPFFLFRVDSFERSFAGMLAWEPRMATDLATFYPDFPPPTPVATSTSSTTPPIENVTAVAFSSSFIDAIVENRDVRLLRDPEGRTLMLYGFYDKETLILARNEAAFAELALRLASSRAR